MTDWERRVAWEATLTDEQLWRVASGGLPLRMPEDWMPEDETTSEEESK